MLHINFIKIILIGYLSFIPLVLHAKTPDLTASELQEYCGSSPPYYGYRFNQVEIDALLKQWLPSHQKWIEEHKLLEKSREELDTIMQFPFVKDVRRINLCGANLSGLDLSRRDLSLVNFAHAELINTKLAYSNLIKTDFTQADLTHSDLEGSNLSGAQLIWSNLSSASLLVTFMDNTDFYYANLSESTFYPSPSAIPDPMGFAPTLINRDQLFRNVKYYDIDVDSYSPMLTILRNHYRNQGMRSMERIITYLIQVKTEERNWRKGGISRISSILSWIFFNLTTQYGLNPQNALTILLSSVLLFTLVYWYALRIDSKHNQFEIVWASKYQTSNIRRGVLRGKIGIMDIFQPLRFQRQNLTLFQTILLELKILRIALYFSVITSFQIGWREYNIGEWISKLQTREFTLQIQKGWIRSVSGFQSLINLYLLVIWILTQFGRPFDS